MAQNTTISIAYKIEGVGNGFQKLTVDADAFRKLMEATVTEADKLKKSFMDFSTISNGLKNIGSAMDGLSSVVSQVSADYVGFDKAMKAANTMAGKDTAGFKKLKEDVSELAKQLPIARDELANGLYQVISNGVPEDNWLEYLQASARSAVGGIADINKVVGVTSTVIKNYGLEWGAAGDIQDKIQLTAKNGVTSFEQLAQALPRVTGNAATLGVSIDELLGTFATLTGVSGNTAEVSTQLAAIFTALVKPSSEASKMAAQMGIQFDAAAIKAAGGFQQFLKDLDQSIKTYSQANGMLEQEVYGKLFGSAESLRALIPLQGELSEKFSSNVAAMVDSAGTMDAAFNDMSSTGEAVTQVLKNNYAAIMDVVGGLLSGIQPYLTFSAGLTTTATNTMILVGAFKQLSLTQHLVAIRTALLHARTIAVNAVIKATALFSKKTALALEMLRVASKGSERAALGLQIALRGLLMATGVGAVIVGITWAIQQLTGASGDASSSLEKLDDATDSYIEAATKAKGEIDKEIESLEELIKTRKSSQEAIDHLNETYGELFGQHNTEKEWYDILIGKSKEYIKQIGYEAQAQSLRTRLNELSIRKDQAAEKKAELEKSGKNKRTVTYQSMGSSLTVTSETKEYKEVCKELDELSAAEDELQKKIDEISEKKSNLGGDGPKPPKEIKVEEMTWQQAKDAIDKAETDLKNANPNDSKTIKQLKAYYDKVKARKELLDKQYGFGNQSKKTTKKKIEIANPKTSEELSNNIEIYKKKLTDEDTEEQRIFREKIARWEKTKEAIDEMLKQADRPTSLSTLEDIDKEINYQRTLRQKAQVEDLNGIEEEIMRLESLRESRELAAHSPLPIEEIKTYEQLNAELSYYNRLLEKADETQRNSIQGEINRLEDLKKAWDKELDELKKPADISSLDSIEKLDEAISYYQARQKEATGDEIQNIQKTIDAHERKRTALQRGIEIPTMLHEADEINKLTGKEYKVKIGSMGFDELTSKIRELQKMLDDVDHPVTESQRKDIESLIGVYEQWRKEGVMTFDTFRNGWGSLKSLGDGVESLTQTLHGNGNAWQTVTGIVDGFLQIYDGIKTIVTIIDMLSMATAAHTAAKTAEAVAVGTATGAQAAEAITAEANAAAQAPVIAANKLATASYMELAAAAYFAAHASIPFAGFGIASGFVTAATAMVEAIGVTPFADGGIVSGPTLGLVGEYAGARNNPEVIAPLDKLRAMIEPSDNGGGKVVFKIAGRTLVGILEKETNLKYRT